MISKVFITGATGFLGSTLAINLVKKNFDVSVLIQKNSNRSRLKEIENKILYVMNDDASLNNFFAQHRTDLIIHTACSYGRKNESISSILNSNLNLGIKLLELAEKNSIPFFINTHTALPRNMNAYSLSKHQFRDWLLKKNNYTKTMSIIFDHMYGPGDDDTKFIKLLSNKIINNEIINLTKCDQKRDFIYISDLVDAYLHLISSLKTNLSREYNEFEISSGKTIILKEFVNLLFDELQANHSNIKNNIKFGSVDYRELEPMNVYLDSTKIHALGWAPRISISEGIRSTISEL